MVLEEVQVVEVLLQVVCRVEWWCAILKKVVCCSEGTVTNTRAVSGVTSTINLSAIERCLTHSEQLSTGEAAETTEVKSNKAGAPATGGAGDGREGRRLSLAFLYGA